MPRVKHANLIFKILLKKKKKKTETKKQSSYCRDFS